ncbi:hypothetical protein Nepgr_001683 [Nepenthes gracilis]|uniref:Uncharacterized protein n=1 Tax=Nepenthes gracilis TaxID=150966 RepID=A0AAD3P8M3_NEPGR|nr:hypothetical protein Nepgr_001683 [Nepenthes gracilis]
MLYPLFIRKPTNQKVPSDESLKIVIKAVTNLLSLGDSKVQDSEIFIFCFVGTWKKMSKLLSEVLFISNILRFGQLKGDNGV